MLNLSYKEKIDLMSSLNWDYLDTYSIRNMLSNKLSAIFRYAAKDIADIREIALHETVDWSTVIGESFEN